MSRIIIKIKKILEKPQLIVIKLITSRFGKIIPDKQYLKIMYKMKCNLNLNLENPKRFNEKLQWLKLYNRNPDYTKMVDKYEVKEYISKLIGYEYIIPTLKVYNKFEEINFEELPNQFVIKTTNDSGGIVICKDKNTFDIKKAQKKITKSLKKNYFYYGREWPYKNVKPKIIIEKYMEDDKTKELQDYKIMCFNGKAKMSFTCTERFTNGLKVTFFDLQWNKLPFERHYPNSKKIIPKPLNYQKMIELSEILAKDIPFVRVDWYEINNKLYFGELTFFPGNGYEEFTPDEWDFKLGKMLDLHKKTRKE